MLQSFHLNFSDERWWVLTFCSKQVPCLHQVISGYFSQVKMNSSVNDLLKGLSLTPQMMLLWVLEKP